MSKAREVSLVILILIAVAAVWSSRIGSGIEESETVASLSDRDKPILRYLAQIHDVDRWGNVWPKDGKFLHDLIVEHGYQRGLEIGTSTGYSAIWMGMALQKTGGKLVTIEIDSELAALARENFARTQMENTIELREGDALEIIPQLEGPFDFVFIDAYKPDYVRYLKMVYPKVRRDGAILAHDAVWHAGQMQDFLRTIVSNPSLKTHIELPSGAGISVSIKKGSEPIQIQSDLQPERSVTP